MKMFINTRLFDTDRAKLVAEWETGEGVPDNKRICEKCFVTDKLTIVLLGSGGLDTEYARPGDSRRSKTRLVGWVVTIPEFISWVQRRELNMVPILERLPNGLIPPL